MEARMSSEVKESKKLDAEEIKYRVMGIVEAGMLDLSGDEKVDLLSLLGAWFYEQLQVALDEQEPWKDMSDDDLLFNIIHWDGDMGDLLPDWAIRGIYLKCDGFGDLGYDELEERYYLMSDRSQTVEWDWSHVRDASEKARKTAASLARTLLRHRGQLDSKLSSTPRCGQPIPDSASETN